eukprot:TRINITY_DN426_c0_g1_i1.p1 TRINITY_DN426_c0_g1~~TRINITY_DN426_c0_g1_i1.p1  ORF type:complete len:256 (-),score=55.08 TRINITY_DN426_c0_g1_i1:60-827(-)
MSLSKLPVYVLPASVAANALTSYCPSANDLTVAYKAGGSVELFDRGWTISGGAGVATKAAFSLLGGSVEYDMDVSQAHTGCNADIYTISPSNLGTAAFDQSKYCDGAKTGSGFCVEVDWIESNGNCGGASTLHTVPGPGNDGCTAWGCRETYYYNGRTSFHMKISYGEDGTWTTVRDGETITPENLSPKPLTTDVTALVDAYKNHGALIYSSHWTGWVPATDKCPSTGELTNSTFSIKNLKINGELKQGPTPTVC